jgi:hypothetical protein
VEVRTALDAARALVAAFSLSYGELHLQVAAGEITLVRAGSTLKPEQLEEIALPLEASP